jgi:hypothetical protein
MPAIGTSFGISTSESPKDMSKAVLNRRPCLEAAPTRRAAPMLVAVVALSGLISCSAGGSQPGGSQPRSVTRPGKTSPTIDAITPPAKTSPSVHVITPLANRLPTDSSAATGETVPWTLVRVDNEKNRIYLSAGQVSCAVPSAVHLQETPTEIIIAVTGPPSSAPSDNPCTARKVSLVGYVQLNEPVGGRRIVGNTE